MHLLYRHNYNNGIEMLSMNVETIVTKYAEAHYENTLIKNYWKYIENFTTKKENF